MKKYLAICVLCMLVIKANAQPQPYKSGRGVLDLRRYQFNEPVSLSGEWYFAWKDFLPDSTLVKQQQFITVPGHWKGSIPGVSASTNSLGYATYGLKVLLPDKGRNWALLLPPIPTAYELFIDGQLVQSAGRVGKDAGMVPTAASHVVYFTTQKPEIFIRLHVSNYHFSASGLWLPLQLGPPTMINGIRERAFIISAFLFGSLLIMAVYQLAVFLFRKKDKGPLYFSIMCLGFALREALSVNPLLFYFFPGINYHFAIKLLYTSFPLCLICFTFFLEATNTIRFKPFIKKTVVITCLFYILLVWITPNYIHGNYLPAILLLSFLISLYTLGYVIWHLPARPKENPLMALGIAVCLLCLLNDSLFEAGYVRTAFLLPFGFFFFLVCQCIILAVHFSSAFSRTEEVLAQLYEINAAYEQMAVKRKQTEEEKAMEALKTRFLSNVTHEFKTPLSLILAPVEFLMQKMPGNQVLQDTLNTISKNARRLLVLINQLLDLSKLDAGKMEHTNMVGRMGDFMSEIITSFRELARTKDITLDYIDHTEGEVYCLFDADKLEKICYNLLSNAIKFTPVKGAISLALTYFRQERADWIRITVADNGAGMTKEELSYIFKPFYQVIGNGRESINGTGIGLALVKEFVDLLQGRVAVDSTPGRGSAFTIELPVTIISAEHQPENILAEAPAEQALLPAEGVYSILVVDDNVDFARYLRQMLQPQYKVSVAHDGNQGWGIVCNDLPDLVISDVMMPGKDGYELAQLVKNTPSTNHIGFILLSGKGAEGRLKGLNLGINDYITKPFLLSELKLKVSNQLKYQQALRTFYNGQLTSLSETAPALEPEPVHPFLQELYAVIDKHLDDTAFSVPDLAAELCMSARTLHRKVSAVIEMTPNELIKHYRLKTATGFLSAGHSISEVAYMTGFESPSYFGQCFKEAYQLTPTEYLQKKV